MAKRKERLICSEADLVAHDDEIDRAICGVSLFATDEARLPGKGAHGSSPTFYFVLDELLGKLELDENSHLLDVGCGKGRVLAYFLWQGLPGRVTGVELDPEMAAVARSWSAKYDRIRVVEGSVLDLDLSPFTHFYLFNPFDPNVLGRFIEAVEEKVDHPCTVVHMSDNGDTWWYQGRPGWTQEREGTFYTYRNARNQQIKVYQCHQHYTVWRFDPPILTEGRGGLP